MSKTKGTKPTEKKTSSSASKSEGETSKPGAMKTSEIRDLIDFISKTGLNEVNIETKELKLHVKREPDQKIIKSSPAPMMPMTAPAMAPPPAAAAPPPAPAAAKPAAAGKKTVDIKSPMIGTFYRSGNPDSPPFIS